ncbi:MAG: hypothetical protein GTO40_05210 [Deltaproteobacteria bacterium]|nr:hypothetical protein [Deltaproteobacteria bacterium]
MPKTRISLYYLATYLLFGGFGFLLTPQFTTKLLLSSADFDTIILRVLGMFLIGLGFLIVQVIRLSVSDLYGSTLIMLGVFCICLVAFFMMTYNLFFLIMLLVVFLGVVLTSWGMIQDRGARST